MVIDFDPEIHRLSIKTEYSMVETFIEVPMPAYSGLMFNEIRIFDPINTMPEEYERYYYLGFHFVFDVVEKI